MRMIGERHAVRRTARGTGGAPKSARTGACVALLLQFVGACDKAPTQRGIATFDLSEVRSWAVPDSFLLSGIAAACTGEAVLWSTSAPYVITLDASLQEHHITHLPAGTTPLAAAFVDNSLEIVASEPNAIYYLSRTGEVDSVSHLASRLVLLDAQRSSEAWSLVAMDSTRQVLWYSGSDLTGAHSDGLPRWIVRYGAAVVLTALRYPFTVEVHDIADRTTISFVPPDSALIASLGEIAMDGYDTVVSLTALAVGSGYIQTISHIGSDRRVILLYSKDGLLLRFSPFDVPIGFAASVPERRMLLGSRVTNVTEIVQFKWTWHDDVHNANQDCASGRSVIR